MAVGLWATAMLPFCIASCSGEKKEMVDVAFDPQTSYTMKETNVKTLVSDSGVTRYKVIAATWLMFGKASEPYWYFPDGVYLEKFDTAFNVEASIKADTAYYYERRKIWELDGHVDISNLKGERFQTSQLFWDQNKGSVYSDSFIKITGNDGFVNSGVGFRANQDLTVRQIFNSSAEIPVEMQRRAIAENDTATAAPDDGSGAALTPRVPPPAPASRPQVAGKNDGTASPFHEKDVPLNP